MTYSRIQNRYRVFGFAVLWLLFVGQTLLAGTIQPSQLQVEHLENPIGIGEAAPRLSWRVSASAPEARGLKQSAYRILVASTRSQLESDQGDLWDSGKVNTSDTRLIRYAGKELDARSQCFWKVKLWDGDDKASDWSDVASWSVGLLEHSDWEGDWIGMEDNHEFKTSENVTFLTDDPHRGVLRMRPAKYFRKEFKAKGGIRRATLYATARGVYEVSINGERVGDQYLAPGWTDYHKRLYFQTYDVSDHVREKGANAIGATLSDGWYAGYIGYALFVKMHSNPSGRGYYGETPSLLMQLEIEYENGTREIVKTDKTWKTSLGPITETDILMGESYDARRELGEWTSPKYNDKAWEPVSVMLPYVDTLEAHPGVPVRVTEELAAKQIFEPEPGVYVFDLGQNFAGIPRLKVKGKAGQKVRLRVAEMVRPDKTLVTANLRTARSTDTYTLKGSKEAEVWSPQFVYHGFQYVEVTGIDEKPSLDMITGLVMHSDTPLTGSFECSDPMLNQLYSNIVWTQRANFLEVPTDCPQRDERLGWTGDAQIFVKAATYNADIAAFYKKWLVDLRDSQLIFGSYPAFAPFPYSRPGPPHGTAWMDAGVICPWTIWQAYGDLEVVQDNWQSMDTFMAFRHARDRKKLGTEEGKTWGDWLNLDQPTPLAYIDLCYYAQSAQMMAEMADAIGNKAKGNFYRKQRKEIEASFRKLYLEGKGKLKVSTQTAYALAIFMDLIPEDQQKAAGQELAALVEEKGGRMATGFLGTRHLLPALTKSGQHSVAGKLMHTQEYPSWGYEVKNGATSIWERWNSYIKGKGASNEGMNSFSHYAFGAVGEWMFQNLVGIDQTAPSWTEFRIAPNPTEELSWAKGGFDSPNGLIQVEWKKTDAGGLSLDVSVPANTSARLDLPVSKPGKVRESGKSVSAAEGVEHLSSENGMSSFRLQSGSYRFEVMADS
ncbi:glycoside hydrolase family 78 protein [Pelagicoccus mobilis]|uniref:alpha-L-rhamnosidase n=1 Tax=Pelagicoccus mobilis TaxID=415221 RepID=A0A934RTR0_9BACT|nr:glycoside hydrolase family 78 protein [Pelagicoccus mobilis]MBK1877435.1 glycoside hydrolase family 78 protein [Pelagicoccus mobilis]